MYPVFIRFSFLERGSFIHHALVAAGLSVRLPTRRAAAPHIAEALMSKRALDL
jgi:hypothetical protein